MRGIVPRVEFVLIATMVICVVLIAQQSSFKLFRIGLLTMMAATVLNIAVGNLPRDASAGGALARTVLLLAIVAAVFGIGIWLVPYLAMLGR